MVRTRGNLARRGSNDAPESSRQGGTRKRPTASARRRGQHEANVVEDDIVQNEVSDVPREDEHGIDNDGGGFPGGPYDTSLLTRYQDHVARMIWDGQVSKKFLYRFNFIVVKYFYCCLFLLVGSSCESGLPY